MKRLLSVLLVVSAVGVLAHARPASACGAQQKTTTSKADEKATQQQKVSSAEPQQQGTKTGKAKAAPQADAGAQAKNDAAAARAQQR